MFCPPLLLLPLLLLVPACRCDCRLSEFACHDGQRCVPASKFCDGNDDCGDLSDEPNDCTNCNRTFYAEANVKSAVRMSTPYQRPLPFVCSMTFVAAGGPQYGDFLQITFLSFQVGSLEMDNDSSAACPKGHLQIVEPPSVPSALLSQQTRGFSQILSALKEPPSRQLSARFEGGGGRPPFGRLCGDMVGKSATFYTRGHNVTLHVVIPPRAALHPHSFSVHLTYKGRVGRKQAPPPPASDEEEDRYQGNKLPNTYCDRVLVNCDRRKRCVLRSPGFPGFYPRNVTCHFWVRQESVPRGRRASIVLAQANEYKISLYTGRSSPLSYTSHVSLTEECHADVIRVFDGPSTASPLLVQFCGTGTLAEVISSSPEILVQLVSAPSQALHHSYAEIEASVRFEEAGDLRWSPDSGRCDFVVDGARRRAGLLYSPRHTTPRNTSCAFRLRGAGPHDRVWLYFLSYFAEDRHPWSRRETCDAGSLDIYDEHHHPPPPKTNNRRKKDAAAQLLVTSDVEEHAENSVLAPPHHEWWSSNGGGGTPSYRFCEKTYPRVCARAADAPRHVPVRPCIREGYLSRGPHLLLRHTKTSVWSSSFTLRYEFVDTGQHGATEKDPCDRRFESSSGRGGRFGSVASPRNVFLFGRGGTRDLTCRYVFEGAPGERVQLTFTDIRLKGEEDCRHHYDPVVQRHTCIGRGGGPEGGQWGGSGRVEVVERTPGRVESPLACFCDLRTETKRPVVVESVTSHVTVVFSVTGMGPFEDFEDFGFEGVYEFLPVSPCEASLRKKNGSSEGEVIFQVPTTVEGRPVPLRCRWLLEAAPHKYLYLRFRGGTGEGDECLAGNRIIVYSSLPPVTPLSVVCLGAGATPSREATLSIAGAESASSSAAGADAAVKDGSHSTKGRFTKEVDVFSNFWYNETADPQMLRDQVYIEVVVNHSDTVRFEWIEVTKPYPAGAGRNRLSGREGGSPCFECPELNACIGAELWCDGRRHCPSGYDEAPVHCDRFPTPYVVAGATAGVVILLVFLALLTLRYRGRREEFKESQPVPTEDFPMDSPHA